MNELPCTHMAQRRHYHELKRAKIARNTFNAQYGSNIKCPLPQYFKQRYGVDEAQNRSSPPIDPQKQL